MANIVFMMDIEEGHILPSFPFAHSLKKAGHNVLYLSILDSEDLIRNAGFDFTPIFTEYYPKGFKKTYRKMAGLVNSVNSLHLESFFNNSFDSILETSKPDILFVTSFLHIEILILFYKYNIRPIILSPCLYESESDITNMTIKKILELPTKINIHFLGILEKRKLKYSSFQELVEPLNSFYHFIMCSEALEIKSRKYNKNTFYIGSGWNKPTNGGSTPLVAHDKKKLIYASMGSQAKLYKDKFNLLFSKLTAIMQRPEMTDFHLFFSIGDNTINDNLENNSDYIISAPNINVLKWANQIEILKEASVAFIHGGLSTIKECIFSTVPMIVIPGGRDQPANAERVEYHKIGTVIQIETISEDDLTKVILAMINDKAMKERLLEMKNNFELVENENRGLSIINKILSDNQYKEHN